MIVASIEYSELNRRAVAAQAKLERIFKTKCHEFHSATTNGFHEAA